MRAPGSASRPIICSQPIAAEPGDVWAVISAPGNLEECHPFCLTNPVELWPGDSARDSIEYYNGRVVTRQFTAWLEGVGYDLEVCDSNGPAASVSWRLSAQDSGGATLTITLTPHMLGNVPSTLRWVPEFVAVRPLMRRYLRAVLRGIEWRVATGERVRRNQFGPHVWFSRREPGSKTPANEPPA